MGATYDTNSAALLTSTGMNSDTTTVNTYDALMRPVDVSSPAGGGSFHYWYAPSAFAMAHSMGNGNFTAQWTFYDAYGRVARTAIGHAAKSAYISDTCYDNLGRKQYVSQAVNVAYPGDDPNLGDVGSLCLSQLHTTYTYDALGRVTLVSKPDGTSVRKEYAGWATRVTDENGLQRLTQTDPSGRIIGVCEVSSTSYAGINPGDCNMDIPPNGYVTSYTYDPANHKTTIVQGAQTRVFQADWIGRPTLISEPEAGVTTYSYSSNSIGSVVTRTRPHANQTGSATTDTVTQYDAVGRVQSITYSDGTPSKSFIYDIAYGSSPANSYGASKGRLVEAQVGNLSTATWFYYDPMGRVTRTLECFPGRCGNPTFDVWRLYEYDEAGNITKQSYFDLSCCGTQVDTNYTYTIAGEVSGISNTLTGASFANGAVLSNVTQTPFGPQSYTFGNGLTGYQTFDPLGRTSARYVCSGAPSSQCGGGAQLYGTQAVYSGQQVPDTEDTIVGHGDYRYDDLNRLTQANLPSQGGTFGYSYDRYGNRTAAGTGGVAALNYDTSSNRITTSGYTYDAAGNLLSDGSGNSYGYDGEGSLIESSGGGGLVLNSYDAFNRRVRSDHPWYALDYAYDLSSQRVEEWDAVSASPRLVSAITYWNGRPIMYHSAGTVHFQHKDLVGTERLRTGADGTPESTFGSLPFGDGAVSNGPETDLQHFALLDHDVESNTEHAQFRQYSSTQGRWLSPDPYRGSYHLRRPQSFNRYSYVGNNPLSGNDPLGLEEISCGDIGCAVGVGEGGGGDGGGGGGGGVSPCEFDACVTTGPPDPPATNPNPCDGCSVNPPYGTQNTVIITKKPEQDATSKPATPKAFQDPRPSCAMVGAKAVGNAIFSTLDPRISFSTVAAAFAGGSDLVVEGSSIAGKLGKYAPVLFFAGLWANLADEGAAAANTPCRSIVE